MEMLEKLLRQGETITFDNELFCEATESDDFRSAECSFRNETKNTWANGFQIMFNGKLFSFKTFIAFRKKLNQLQFDWNLEINHLE